MEPSPTNLDGNAAAGPLADLFGFDITRALGRCSGCGYTAVMARCTVFAAGPGLVMRCSECDHVLVRLVVAGERRWLDMTGVDCLQIDDAD